MQNACFKYFYETQTKHFLVCIEKTPVYIVMKLIIRCNFA